jgi:hypothetical protein
MEYNEIAAKRRKKRKRPFVYAPFALFRGYSAFPVCRLCQRFLSKTCFQVPDSSKISMPLILAF